MRTAQIALSVVDGLALVGVLALYLLLVARRLRAIAESLGRVASGARGLDSGATAGGGVGRLNWQLEQLATELATAADVVREPRGGR